MMMLGVIRRLCEFQALDRIVSDDSNLSHESIFALYPCATKIKTFQIVIVNEIIWEIEL